LLVHAGPEVRLLRADGMFKMEINIDRHGTVFIPGKFVNSTNKLKQMLSFLKVLLIADG
jgi:hypothetical protein